MKRQILTILLAFACLTAKAQVSKAVKCTDNIFMLKGKVASELNVDRYLVYIWDYAQKEMPQPVDTLKVKNGKFEFFTTLDQPYSGMMKAVKKDGTTGEFFLEFFFVPGEECKIDVKGDGLNEFTLGGSKFYRDWEAFAQFYEKTQKKAIALNGAGDEEFFASIAKYNRQHKDEEGCLMYQCMWLSGSAMNFSMFDGIQDGRFKSYIQHRKNQYSSQGS
ncbi:MAG: DUF4369 domain-containing protein [Bacteroidaceae bacterium]|nr:DUF4369 domain-containing protein [Bacteroidaceae bacterium]